MEFDIPGHFVSYDSLKEVIENAEKELVIDQIKEKNTISRENFAVNDG